MEPIAQAAATPRIVLGCDWGEATAADGSLLLCGSRVFRILFYLGLEFS
jgi:hypothetical protein